MTLIEAPGGARTTAISLRGVSKAFGHGGSAVVALDGINLDVAQGEFVCLVGASGCGKSTSLNLIAGLDRPTVGDVSVHGRTALMFQEAALFPWLTVRDNVALPLRLAGMGKAAAPPAGRRAAGAGPPGRPGRPAAPRALGRHAPAGRPGPGPGPGRRDPAHGRALRRPRRHDPRPAARRARAGVVEPPASPSSSSPTTCGRRPAWPTASSCSPACPARWPTSSRSPSTGPAGSTRPRSWAWPPRSPTACGPRSAATATMPMATELAGGSPATDLRTDAKLAEEIAGLDALEAHSASHPSRARQAWSTVWPKLAAIASPSSPGRRWCGRGGRPEYVLPGPDTVLPGLVDLLGHRQVLDRGRASPCAGPSPATPSPWSSARSSALPWPAVRLAAHRRRLADHRPADHAVDRLVPAGHPAVRADRAGHHVRGRAGRGPVDRQRAHRRRRPRAARSWCGPGG